MTVLSPERTKPSSKNRHPWGESSRLDALSGIRFFAISYIVCYHVGDSTFEHAPALVETFRTRADVLMPLFFVLSGFVLTYAYGERVAERKLSKREFWISRLLRLWPIYLVALLLADLSRAFAGGGMTRMYVAGAASQALLLQGWTPPLVSYGNPPGWTVSVEIFCYLLFPSLAAWMKRARFQRAAVVVGAAWLAGQLVSLAFVLSLPGDASKAPNYALFYDLLRYLPPLHLPSFLIGMLTARIFHSDRARGRKRRSGLIVLGGFLPIVCALGDGVHFLGKHGMPFFVHPVPFTHNGLLAPAWALVVFGLAHGGTPARWLGSRPIVRVGEASYGLYILHAPFKHAVEAFVLPGWENRPWFLVQFFAVIVPLCVLSFERFEQPLRNALLRRWRVSHPH